MFAFFFLNYFYTKNVQGFISKSDFKETLKLCFPSKNSDQLDALVKAADDELGAGDHSKIEYKHLFGEVNLNFILFYSM